MSETPRTDAAIEYFQKLQGDGYCTREETVDPDFARELERELAAVAKERDELRASANKMIEDLNAGIERALAK